MIEKLLIFVVFPLLFVALFLRNSAAEPNSSGKATSGLNKAAADRKDRKQRTAAAGGENPATENEDYVDPNFDLPPIVPAQDMTGAVDAPDGTWLYGNERRYDHNLDIGTPSRDATLKLLDRRAYKNEIEQLIIKVEVIKDEAEDEVGKKGWVELDETTFRDWYDGISGTITGPARDEVTEDSSVAGIANSSGDKENSYVDPNFKLASIVPSQKMLGTVDGEHGDAIYGNNKRHWPEMNFGSVSKDAKIELLDRRVYKDNYELDIIKVKVLENRWDDEVGKIGWVSLDATSFRGQYDEKSREIK